MNRIKTLILLCLTLIMSNYIFAQNKIIPQPNQYTDMKGEFIFSDDTRFFSDSKSGEKQLESLISFINETYHTNYAITTHKKKAQVQFLYDETLRSEEYELNISNKSITVKAAKEQGFYYAYISLIQQLSIKKETPLSQVLTIPAGLIKDNPRFGYRGVMLDVSRFFIPQKTLLKIIDTMGTLKLNKLHLHLVDDNGWRIEIKKYPKLTEVGAWRVNRDELFPARQNPLEGESTPIGGFYTQKEMKEIIAYASKRQIEIIPEIEMPAHTISSLAAYPELACPVVNDFIGVLPGIGGPAARIIYCAGNENVFHFLEDVLEEIIDLFPSHYIHLGGDEAQKYYWERCPLCQKRMKNEGIQEVEELQSYFMNRMSKYVQSKGKQVMGWDELTNSTLPKDAIIFGWQGEGHAALKAAAQGHQFIMTPAKKLYFIRYQGPQWFEPFTYFGNNTLKGVYNYEPVKENWDPKYEKLLMGVQGSLWTEFCKSPEDVEYLLFPRVIALSELAWTTPQKKDWNSFILRMEQFLPELSHHNITYSSAIYNIDHQVKTIDNSLEVTLTCDHPYAEIRYAINKLSPSAEYKTYSNPIIINKRTELTAQAYIKNKPVGQTLHLNLNWNKATAKPVLNAPSNAYLLTNGLRGSNRHSDFEWVGWYNQNGSFIIDLTKETRIHHIMLGSITNFGMGVHKPSKIEVKISTDNQEYISIAKKEYDNNDIFVTDTHIDDILFDNLNSKARYIKIEFTNPGKCPSNHTRAGSPTWVYFDEILIN